MLVTEHYCKCFIDRKMFRLCSVIGHRSKTCNTLTQTLSRYPSNTLDQVATLGPLVIPNRSKRSRRQMRGFDVGRAQLTFKQSIEGAPDPLAFPRLSPNQVTSILELNQFRKDFIEFKNQCAIKSCDINKLPANSPIEDRDAHARLRLRTEDQQFLFGVFDGHAGFACAQTLLDRLFQYIGVSLAPENVLDKIVRGELDPDDLVDMYENQYFAKPLPDYLAKVYKESLFHFAELTLASFDHHSIEEHIIGAFTRLDKDIMEEGLPYSHNFNMDTLESALSGSCACVALIDDCDLYIGNTGDCRAVLGVQGADEEWSHIELSNVHSCQNAKEVRRVLNAHPNESTHIFKQGRLFGELAPSRAFGDSRYKWLHSEMRTFQEYLSQPESGIDIYPGNVMPVNYKTPPYLTAEPEVIKHTLTPKDKFLVLATDGLWDMLSPEKVVKLVAGHMLGKQVMITQDLNYQKMGTLKEINHYLKRRKIGFRNLVLDDNAATHLLRNAFGPEHGRISAFLSLPESMSRLYRDDTTVLVIFFDSDYIMNKNVSESVQYSDDEN